MTFPSELCWPYVLPPPPIQAYKHKSPPFKIMRDTKWVKLTEHLLSQRSTLCSWKPTVVGYSLETTSGPDTACVCVTCMHVNVYSCTCVYVTIKQSLSRIWEMERSLFSPQRVDKRLPKSLSCISQTTGATAAETGEV